MDQMASSSDSEHSKSSKLFLSGKAKCSITRVLEGYDVWSSLIVVTIWHSKIPFVWGGICMVDRLSRLASKLEAIPA